MDATEVQTNAPICKTIICKLPLTWMEKQRCWRCLKCNPLPKDVLVPQKKKKFLDVKVTEEQVAKMIKEAIPDYLNEDKIREIVRDELENWHIQRPPATRDEIAEALPPSSAAPKPETWLQKAKRIGVQTHYPKGGMRKKVDVLADMEAKEKEVQPVSGDGLVSPEGDTKTYETL